ncbi:hypothetical protein [Chitinophaga ginsengisoli]|nr:hypothetical protein [Chitinophaga ginsengisoli]
MGWRERNDLLIMQAPARYYHYKRKAEAGNRKAVNTEFLRE